MPPEYQSPNGFGDSAPASSEAQDLEPTSEQIEQWNEEGSAPEAENSAEQESASGEPPPAKEERKPEAKSKPKESPYAQAKEKAKKQQDSTTNELYKQIRLLTKHNRDLTQKLQFREQGLDQKPEDWLALATEFEQSGDFSKAEQAKAKANELRQAQFKYQNETSFKNAWHSNEAEILEQDPDLFNQESETGRRLSQLFNDPELGTRYRSHPDGIWAAYHRVKLEQASELIPKLVQFVEHLQSENQRLKKGMSPMKSTPGKGHSGPRGMKDMSDDELERAAYAEASAIDDGRR